VTFQHTAEDEPRQRQRGLRRVTDRVEEVVVREPFSQRAAPRVDQHHESRAGRSHPELLQGRVVQLCPRSGGGRDLHAAESGGPDLVELADREIWMLQRHGAHADEAVGRSGAVRDDGGGGLLHDARREAAVGPVVR